MVAEWREPRLTKRSCRRLRGFMVVFRKLSSLVKDDSIVTEMFQS